MARWIMTTGAVAFVGVWEGLGIRMPSENRFAELVEQYRLSRGLKQAQIAAYLGVSQGQVSEWKSGQRPPVKAVIRFARLANMDYREALRAAGHWPEDIAINGAPAPAELVHPDLVRVWRRLLDRPDVVAPEAIKWLELWGELPPDVRRSALDLLKHVAADVPDKAGRRA